MPADPAALVPVWRFAALCNPATLTAGGPAAPGATAPDDHEDWRTAQPPSARVILDIRQLGAAQLSELSARHATRWPWRAIAIVRNCGYPTDDSDRRAAGACDEHPDVVEHYRKPRPAAWAYERGEAGTGDLCQAAISCRSLVQAPHDRSEPPAEGVPVVSGSEVVRPGGDA